MSLTNLPTALHSADVIRTDSLLLHDKLIKKTFMSLILMPHKALLIVIPVDKN